MSASVPAYSHRARKKSSGNSLLSQGEPMLWLTAGMLVVCLAMIVGLLGTILVQGGSTFWPKPLVSIQAHDGTRWIGELVEAETFEPTPEFLETQDEATRQKAAKEMEIQGGLLTRARYQTGRHSPEDSHFHWIEESRVAAKDFPAWGVVIDRWAGGRVSGILTGFRIDREPTHDSAEKAWQAFLENVDAVRTLREERERVKSDVVAPINQRLGERERQEREALVRHGAGSELHEAARRELQEAEGNARTQLQELQERMDELTRQASRFELLIKTSAGETVPINLENIVRAYPVNQLDVWGKLGVYASRWWEFLSTEPREGNSEGGVFPAIIGTLVMTLLMSVAVVPFGVLAALYLREYARAGWLVSIIRIAINNLAGVPSVVFGVFGLGFFVYLCGGAIDEAFYWSNKYPVFGQGGVFWASLTLALLTLPVVIVATEESLSAVPNSMREGSYACGASQWQTIRRIVLPRALPGVMTGLILAVARGAGEVAPLMLVGVIEYSPQLPIDGDAPFIHPERPFMHLGFSIYYSAFKSPNSEAARPLVYTTTLLLLAMIALLNLVAIWLRARLRKRYVTQAF